MAVLKFSGDFPGGENVHNESQILLCFYLLKTMKNIEFLKMERRDLIAKYFISWNFDSVYKHFMFILYHDVMLKWNKVIFFAILNLFILWLVNIF